jgi:hypothetical protein
VDGFLVGERDVDSYVRALFDLAGADPAVGRNARRKIEEKFNMSVQNVELQKLYRRAIDGTLA